jgi:hypothetical protein
MRPEQRVQQIRSQRLRGLRVPVPQRRDSLERKGDLSAQFLLLERTERGFAVGKDRAPAPGDDRAPGDGVGASRMACTVERWGTPTK